MHREAEATAAEAPAPMQGQAAEAPAAGAGGAKLPALRSSLKRSATATPITAALDTPPGSASSDASAPMLAEVEKKKQVSASVKAVRAAPLMRKH
jgi:hypothetical protein